MSHDWTAEALEDSSIADALSLIDPALARRAKDEMDALAHASGDGPRSALTESGVPYVSIVGSGVKSEGAACVGDQIVAEGNPLIVTQADVNAAAERALEAWLEGAKAYRKSVCQKAGTGAHIVLTWRLHPTFIMWSDFSHRVRLAMRARLVFEALEDGDPRPGCASSEHNALAPSPHQCCPPVDFFAINKAFSQ